MQGLRPNVRRNYVGAFEGWIRPELGNVAVAEVRGSDLARLKLAMSRHGLAPSTQNGIINAVSRVLDFAVRDGVAESNPAAMKGVRLQVQHAEQRHAQSLPPTEIERIASACDRKVVGFGDPVRIAFLLACRANELWALQAGDVSLDQRRVAIDRAWAGSDQRGRVIETPKSRERRVIPIFDPALPILERLTDGLADDAWLFQGKNGSARWHSNFRERVAWTQLVKELGHPGFRFHDIRHSATTWLLNAGVPVHTVSAILGHASLSTTSIYAHRTDDALDSAIRLINTAFEQ